MVFIDASALVAMLALEPGYKELSDRLDGFASRVTSGVAIWETVTALSRSYRVHAPVARQQISDFLAARAIMTVPIGEEEASLALDAYARYGKGINAAGLNMGDCFAYACAKANDACLLYKGGDFSRTDLAWADDNA